MKTKLTTDLATLKLATLVIMLITLWDLNFHSKTQQEEYIPLKVFQNSVTSMGYVETTYTKSNQGKGSLTKVGHYQPKQSNKDEIIRIDNMNLFNVLEFEEGFSRVPYLCTEGYVTYGLGTKIHKSKGLDPKDFLITINRPEAEQLLMETTARLELALSKSSKGKIFKKLDPARKAIILSMAYQMGVTGLLGFPSMWAALNNKNWEEAGYQALDSLWAEQTSERAHRHARVLAGESLEQVYIDYRG